MFPERATPPELNSETAQQFADIRARCDTSMAALLPEDHNQLDYIVGKAAIAAAKAEDLAGFDRRFDTLLAGTDVSLPQLAQVCLAGIAAGSERAYDTLSSMVEGERKIIQRKRAEDQDLFDTEPVYAYSGGDGLVNIFSSCIETDTPPNTWIEKAAADPMHRWVLYLEYSKYVSDYGTPAQQAALRPLTTSLATELIQKKDFSPTFVRAVTPHIMKLVQDDTLHEFLCDTVLDDLEDHPYADPTKDLGWLARTLDTYAACSASWQLGNGHGSMYHRAYGVLDLIADRIDEAGIGIEHVANGYITIHAALTRYATDKPKDLIAAINAYVVELAEGSPDNADSVYRARDMVLQKHVTVSAESGDFVATRTLLAAIHDDRRKKDTLYDCYKVVKKPEDLEALTVDGLLIDPSSHPTGARLAAEGRIADDPAKVIECLLSLAEVAEANLTYHDYIDDLYRQLKSSHPELAGDAARKVLVSLRAAGARYSCYSKLSSRLISEGDADELARAYTDITTAAMSTNSRIFYLHRLREHIDKRFPELPVSRTQIAANTHGTDEADPVMRAIISLLGTMDN
jgi:hypothetical protein